MAALIDAARPRGITHLHLTCHTLNRPMQRIAAKFDGRLGFDGCECFAEIEVPR